MTENDKLWDQVWPVAFAFEFFALGGIPMNALLPYTIGTFCLLAWMLLSFAFWAWLAHSWRTR